MREVGSVLALFYSININSESSSVDSKVDSKSYLGVSIYKVRVLSVKVKALITGVLSEFTVYSQFRFKQLPRIPFVVTYTVGSVSNV